MTPWTSTKKTKYFLCYYRWHKWAGQSVLGHHSHICMNIVWSCAPSLPSKCSRCSCPSIKGSLPPEEAATLSEHLCWEAVSLANNSSDKADNHAFCSERVSGGRMKGLGVKQNWGCSLPHHSQLVILCTHLILLTLIFSSVTEMTSHKRLIKQDNKCNEPAESGTL